MILQPAAEHPHAGVPDVLVHRMRGLGYVGSSSSGTVIAPSSNEIRYVGI